MALVLLLRVRGNARATTRVVIVRAWQRESLLAAAWPPVQEDEAALLQEALAMSLAEASGGVQASLDVGGSAAAGAKGGAEDAPAEDDDLALGKEGPHDKGFRFYPDLG